MEKQATATMLQSVSWSIFPLGLDRNGVYTLWQAVKAPDCDHQYSKHCTMHTHLSPVITETNTKQFHFHYYHKLLRNLQFLPHDTDAVHKAQCKICDGFVPICLSVQQCCYCIGTPEPIIKQSMLDRIVVTAVCVPVCLSLAAFSHYYMDPDVTWGNGRGCPLVVH